MDEGKTGTSRARNGLWRTCAWCFLVGIWGAPLFAATPERSTLCPGWHFVGLKDKGLIKSFTATEKRLVCGDSDKDAPDAWKTIPENQGRYMLKTFLQQRGYFSPRFEQIPDGTLIDAGAPRITTALEAEGAPDELRLRRKRKVVGQLLTPKLLDTVEQWVTQRLQAEGYACPIVKSEADADTGQIVVRVDRGNRYLLDTVLEDNLEGVQHGVLRRYDAFGFGQLYNGDLLTITSDRIMTEGLVENAHFTTKCPGGDLVVRQNVVPGPPRLLRAGFGLNTEGILLARASWRNTRLGPKASWLELSASGSVRQAYVNALLNWYFLPGTSRISLRPLIQLRHSNERYYETISQTTHVWAAKDWDLAGFSLDLQGGPNLELIRTLRGQGPQDSRFAFFSAEAAMQTHDFEYYRQSPRTGLRAGIASAFSDRNFGATATLQRFGVKGEALWNYRDYDPPLWVVGVRGQLQTNLTKDANAIPATFREYLGGATTLRGFGRQELPRDGLGRLSSVFLGVEIRFCNELPFNLEPFVFLDAGVLGVKPYSWDPPVYHSPGGGVRWASPIGVVRTTLARGFGMHVDGHLQAYLSLGEEF